MLKKAFANIAHPTIFPNKLNEKRIVPEQFHLSKSKNEL